MFEFFKTASEKYMQRIIMLEAEVEGLKVKLTNVRMDLEEAKKKKRIFKEEEGVKYEEKYQGQFLPEDLK